MEYQFINMKSENELIEYRDSFSRNGSTKDLENLRWAHFYNHIKKPMSVIVKDNNGNIASIYATLPVVASVEGVKILVCQSVDTMTDSNHRAKGLFVSAAKATYALNKSEGVGFVYGFPNGKSVYGFIKHLNWHLLDPVPFIFKPLRSGFFLRKILGNKIGNLLDFSITLKKTNILNSNVRIEPVKIFDDKFDALWKVFSRDIKIAIVRDSVYLNWRYINKPNEQYKIVALYEDTLLRGFIVYCFKQKHGGKIGYIMELITDLSYGWHSTTLLNYANNDLICSKCDVILAWCFGFSPNATSFKYSGYFSLPNILRPIELHFGYSNINCNNAAISERRNWYLSYSDSDTV